MVGMAAKHSNAAKREFCFGKTEKARTSLVFFGVHFALLIVNWDAYRLPAAFRLIRPKGHPEFQNENELFREMVLEFIPPYLGYDGRRRGGYSHGSQDNMKMVMQRDADAPARRSLPMILSSVAQIPTLRQRRFQIEALLNRKHRF